LSVAGHVRCLPIVSNRAARPLQRLGTSSRLSILVGLALVASLVAAGCSSTAATGNNKGGAPLSGGTATFAELPASIPNYIFPFTSLTTFDFSNNSLLQRPLFLPLYWYGDGKTVDIDTKLSIANLPVYSDGDRTVTITLNKYRWSDGTPVTSRDVQFWINILLANKDNFATYTPGAFPDDVTNFDYPNANTIVMHLNAAVSPQWFTYDSLPQIVPIPQQAWDRETAGGPVGNYDMTTAGAHKVYSFLDAQSKVTSTYVTNPLWKVVDGPWRLVQYSPTGAMTLAPNSHYSGTPKPRLSKVEFLPFTSAVAENDAVLAGKVDYGYVSPIDAPELPRIEHLGYTVSAWPEWGLNYLYPNYTNPTSGPFMKQQYVRIALQELTNQPEIVKDIYHGYAYPTYGPTPARPKTVFNPSGGESNAYPYDPSDAIQRLQSHGWHVVPNGTTTCVDAAKCGVAVKAGTNLTISVVYPSGYPDIQEMMESIKSSMSAAGVTLNLTAMPGGDIGALLSPCKPGSPCRWGLLDFVVGWYFSVPFPDGGELFGTGAASYEGTAPYTAMMERLINAIRVAPANEFGASLAAYETYAQAQNPALWVPMTYYQLSVVKSTLQGTQPQNPVQGQITPAAWYLTR